MGFNWALALWLVLGISNAYGQEAAPTVVVAAPAAKPVDPKAPPAWDDWFNNNATVTDKTDYVHFFWNAQDSKAYFEVKGKKSRLAEAALQLVARLYPADAKADPVKVDIVYVAERDTYGIPRWDTLQKVAHFEFSRAKAQPLAKTKKPLPESSFKKVFDQFEFY